MQNVISSKYWLLIQKLIVYSTVTLTLWVVLFVCVPVIITLTPQLPANKLRNSHENAQLPRPRKSRLSRE